MPDTALLIKTDIEHGLKPSEVILNRKKYGSNILTENKLSVPKLLLRQATGNPMILILVTATVVSSVLKQNVSSFYIFLTIAASIGLGFWNEYGAEKVVSELLKKIANRATVIRGGKKTEVPATDIVAGDVVYVGPADVIPADFTLLESENLEINESSLTGESIPVYKTKETVYMGTVVIGGWGKGIVQAVGKSTEFGKISENVSFVKPRTDFEKGLSKFGGLLLKVIVTLTVGIFFVNFLLGRDPLVSLLFSLAIAVGITPELLPVIVTVSLSHGAGKLAKKHVIAKQLVSIENLGNMDVLCMDKTGTLTEGSIELVNIESSLSKDLLESALLCNSAVVKHKIMGNPLDVAIWHYAVKNKVTLNQQFKKLFEEPFNYDRKAACVVVEKDNAVTMIVKGAPEDVFKLCDEHVRTNADKLVSEFIKLSMDGYRVIALAQKDITKKDKYNWSDAHSLKFLGFLSFLDVPKKGAKESLTKLRRLNVGLKVLTGDNEIITRKICSEVGLGNTNIMLGHEMDPLSDEQLAAQINTIDVFARVSPEQKLRVIRVLKNIGHTVGYLGDGVNDIPALHSADVGISVNTGVDVAKNAASIVLLRKGLDILAEGIVEGRKTFSNTIKYILMGTSSNFGNMFSAAVSSFVLPFLPMTPAQILINNGLYDVSQMSIPSDNVDEESLLKPRHWNVNFIKNYMIFFGPISSIYDFLTYGVMYFVFHARDGLFQAGWFIESMATQILVVFVIRTARTPFYKSRPGKLLTITCLSMVALAVALPFSPLAKSLGFVAPPFLYFVILIVFVITYLALVEIAKKLFLRRFSL
jgi:P-type Mg2+ transporter